MQIINLQQNKDSLTVISLLWTALVVVHTLFIYHFAEIELNAAITDSLVFNGLFALLGGGIIMALEYERAGKPLSIRITYRYLPMLLIVVMIWLMGAYSILNSIELQIDYNTFLLNSMKYRSLIGVFLFSIVVIVHQLVVYYRNYQQKQIKATQLENELQRSRVDTLQMQMQPHFLFNALNSISALTFEDSTKTRQMLIKLSDFLRYTTKYSEQQLVQLTDELSHIDQYLSIENLRFGERLVYRKNVSKEACERFLPCLVLQPIIENAIKHGVNQSIETVIVQVNAHIELDKLCIVISNTKDGESIKKGTGTGLKNLANRLKILYSDRAKLIIENTPNLFTVKIIIP